MKLRCAARVIHFCIRQSRCSLSHGSVRSSSTVCSATELGSESAESVKSLRRLRTAAGKEPGKHQQDGNGDSWATEKAQKDEAFKNAIASINKKKGQSTIQFVNKTSIPDAPRIPTGIYALDEPLGGGVPIGRVVEIYGPESSGKTSLALLIVAQAQKFGKQAMFVDLEHALDLNHAQRLGVDIDSMAFTQPNNGEDCMMIVESMCQSGSECVIVVDSVAALVTQSELERDHGDPTPASTARLMSSSMKRIASAANTHKATVIFINQTRSKIGIVYGNPETTTGGNALKFYSSQRLEVRKADNIPDPDDKAGLLKGIKVKVKIVKNKVSSPTVTPVTFDLIFDGGIDVVGSLLDELMGHGIVFRRGAHVYLDRGGVDVKLGHGRDNAISALKAPEGASLFAELEELRDSVRRGALQGDGR